MLPNLARPLLRPARPSRPATVGDRLLGVSRRRRHAAYVAFGAGLKLLRPMLVRIGVLVGSLVFVAFASLYLRLVF